MNKLIIVILALFIASCAAPVQSSELFGVDLNSENCSWTDGATAQISVAGIDFHLSKEFQFRGIFRGAAFFSGLDESGNSSRDSIHYYPKGFNGVGEDIDDFQSLLWNGIRIYYKSGYMGKVRPVTLYHIFIINNDERISFLSDSLDLIVGIVACSIKND